MPTIYRLGGFRIVIYPHDHPPPHVHVLKADGAVVIELDSLRVRDVVAMRDKDVIRAVDLVADVREMLLKNWETIHG